MDGIGLASGDVFLVGGAGSRLSEGQRSVQGRVWTVCGFSVPVDCASGFGIVRHFSFHSRFKVALSACPHCRQPATYP